MDTELEKGEQLACPRCKFNPGMGNPVPCHQLSPALGDTTSTTSMPHPWDPTYLFYLLLVAVGTHTLKGLFSVICIPALLVICLFGL